MTPSTPHAPNPSTTSLVSRNGTVSGVFKHLPCSNATPRSMWIISALVLSSRMLDEWRSPSPTTYPTIEFTATDRVYVTRDSHHARGDGKFSRKKWCITGLNRAHTASYAERSCSRVWHAAKRSRHSRCFRSLGR